ncbi:MAG: APC family permease [Mycobacteriales bacterium]
MTAEERGLRRVLTTRDLAVYYLSSLVGAGVLVVPGIALEVAGPASLLAWVILSLASLPIALTFARFSARYPSAGGVSFLVRTAFGWRPGAMIGLFLLFLNLATNPILGLAAARYLAALFGWQDQGAVLLAGFGVMSLGVLTNMLGIRVASRVQFALVASLVVGLVTVAAVSAPAADVDRLTPFAPNGWWAVGAAIVVCFFSFFGWENVAHAAEEVQDPERSYPRAALVAASGLGLLYCTLALMLALVVPADAATDKNAVLSAMLELSHGETAARVGAALAVALLVITTNAWVLGASRLLFAMSRDGAVPRRLSRVSGRNGAPLAALTVAGVCYGIDFLVLRLIGGDESSLVPFTAASILVVYLATFLAGLRLFPDRRTRTLCAVALAAVTAFLHVGGLASLLALLAFAATAGYVLLRGRALQPAAGPLGAVGGAADEPPAPAQAETPAP